jgi:hypothetical protein
LDFLGFSRPNRDFSIGYAGFSLKEISHALLPSAAAPERCLWFRACGSAGLLMPASLT